MPVSVNREEFRTIVEGGFVEVAEAAEFLCISRAKLYQLMDAGELAYCKFGRARRIPKRALYEYAQSKLIPT
jgi:excisionase family DNA binding protein